MIEEDYVSFEIAKLLKEKGFDEGCRSHYGTSGSLSYEKYEVEASGCEMHDAILAPTLQMTMKWLRESHNIFIAINIVTHVTVTMEQKYYFFKLYIDRRPYNVPLNDSVKLYSSYEEACEAAIKYCLENLI